jgi:hypothetical protein
MAKAALTHDQITKILQRIRCFVYMIRKVFAITPLPAVAVHIQWRAAPKDINCHLRCWVMCTCALRKDSGGGIKA